MNRPAKLAFVILTGTFLPLSAYSQGMPPTAHSNSPYYVPPGAQSGNGYSPAKTIILPDQWGAIAADVRGGVLGVSTLASRERIAKKNALRECRSKGGSNCEVMLSYMNQCAAFVIGSDVAVARHGLDEGAAKESALNYCRSNDVNCRVYYSACSLPQRPL